MEEKKQRIRELTEQLNRAAYAYEKARGSFGRPKLSADTEVGDGSFGCGIDAKPEGGKKSGKTI